MAVDMFIKIGDIKGESKDDKHKDEIDVLAWTWGMSQSGTTHMSSGGSGKVNVRNLSLTKSIDKASPNLMKYCCTGKHYDQAVLTVREAGGEPLEYLKITMKEVLIASVSTGGSHKEEKRFTENVVLNFAEFKVEYTPQKDDGTAGAPIPAGFNIATNKETA